jgi:hypothetical protein
LCLHPFLSFLSPLACNFHFFSKFLLSLLKFYYCFICESVFFLCFCFTNFLCKFLCLQFWISSFIFKQCNVIFFLSYFFSPFFVYSLFLLFL